MSRKRNRRIKHRQKQKAKPKLEKYKEKKEHQRTITKITVVGDPDEGLRDKKSCKVNVRQNTGPSKCWESNLHVSSNEKCPHINDNIETDIAMPYDLWQKIIGLTRELSTEWLGYLGASRLQNGQWKVINITVPKQKVTGAHVQPTETIHSEGVIHSHVNMGAFFSGTDDNYLNENHEFSIVINKRAEIKAVIRHKLPCGSMTLIDAHVVIDEPEAPDVSAFINAAKENIEEERYNCGYNYRNQYGINWGWNNKKGKFGIIKKHNTGGNMVVSRTSTKNNDKVWDVDDDDDDDDKTSNGKQSKLNYDQDKLYDYMDYGDIYDGDWAAFAD